MTRRASDEVADGLCVVCFHARANERTIALAPELDDETVAVLRAVASGKAPAALLEFLRAHLECEAAQLSEEKLVSEEAPEARCLEAEVRVDAAVDREIKATSALQAMLVESMESLGNSGGDACPS